MSSATAWPEAHQLAQLRLVPSRRIRPPSLRRLDVTGQRIEAADAQPEAQGKLDRVAALAAAHIQGNRAPGQPEPGD